MIYIGTQAFFRCTGLTDVYFTGTQKQWRSITIRKNNDPLLDAAIHYGSEILSPTAPGDPKDSGFPIVPVIAAAAVAVVLTKKKRDQS